MADAQFIPQTTQSAQPASTNDAIPYVAPGTETDATQAAVIAATRKKIADQRAAAAQGGAQNATGKAAGTQSGTSDPNYNQEQDQNLNPNNVTHDAQGNNTGSGPYNAGDIGSQQWEQQQMQTFAQEQTNKGDPNDPLFGNVQPQFLGQTPANMPTATNWNVTADQTVQGQLSKALTGISDSPLYQQMSDQLVRAHAAAGGGNSLMAQTAAYNTVVSTAFQVAQADAGTYAKSAEFNASMANQFGLANQRFMQEALLSDQNYRQAGVLQTQQIAGNVGIAKIQAGAQVQAAGLNAGAITSAAQIQVQGQLSAIQSQHQNDLQTLDITHQYNMAQSNQQFLQQYALGNQQLAGNFMINAQQDQHQNNLQYGAETASLLQQQIASGGQIGSTPGLSADQQAAGMTSITNWTKNAQNVLSSLYMGGGSSPLPSQNNGTGGQTQVPGAPPGQGSSYTQFGNYLNYNSPNWQGTANYNGSSGGSLPNVPLPDFASNNFLPDAGYESSLSGSQYQQYEGSINSPLTDQQADQSPMQP